MARRPGRRLSRPVSGPHNQPIRPGTERNGPARPGTDRTGTARTGPAQSRPRASPPPIPFFTGPARGNRNSAGGAKRGNFASAKARRGEARRFRRRAAVWARAAFAAGGRPGRGAGGPPRRGAGARAAGGTCGRISVANGGFSVRRFRPRPVSARRGGFPAAVAADYGVARPAGARARRRGSARGPLRMQWAQGR